MKKTYIVEYYIEATVSFSAEIEANNEKEAKEFVRTNMGSKEHNEMDWETNSYIFTNISEAKS